MESGNRREEKVDIRLGAENAYRLSWTAYAKPIIVLLIVYAIAYRIYLWRPAAGVAVAIAWTAIFALTVCSNRAVRLYTNDQGVWVSSGIFPWTKGVSGVRWRDIDEAVFFTGFLAWAFNSYRIRVGHRFTKSSEIVLPSVANGRKAVEYINQQLGEHIRSAALARDAS
ncbi:hypothetical protein GCM10023144_15330 [Pigmentiphaga soli]|uniref:PH domain-containing protein n=1 Tax=Pigmentiphaga soli TaxID=1007095 RepID=A0ABP8GRS9_9BURK